MGPSRRNSEPDFQTFTDETPMPRTRSALLSTALIALGLLAAGPQDTANLKDLKGAVRVDGSSTVYPLSEAVSEEFSGVAPKVNVTVGVSGTGGGFKKFAAGEVDVANASRPIKKAEADMAAGKKIEFIELPVAYDGLTIVVNKANTWARQLTIEQIKRIFGAEGAARTWKDVDPSWPADPIKVYSPGTDSGTFDYFKEVVVGKDGKIRSDISVSENDNVLVRGVEGDKNAIAFFGYSYYVENKAKLNDVKVVNPKSGTAVEPTARSIEDGSYAPFSRPLFIYVNKASLAKPEVRAYVEYFIANAAKFAKAVGDVPLPKVIYERAAANLKALRTGSQFLGVSGEVPEGAIADIYK
jgi:phosphate transport system substrate-binding protein